MKEEDDKEGEIYIVLTSRIISLFYLVWGNWIGRKYCSSQ
jgi:hypothetical protein